MRQHWWSLNGGLMALGVDLYPLIPWGLLLAAIQRSRWELRQRTYGGVPAPIYSVIQTMHHFGSNRWNTNINNIDEVRSKVDFSVANCPIGYRRPKQYLLVFFSIFSLSQNIYKSIYAKAFFFYQFLFCLCLRFTFSTRLV